MFTKLRFLSDDAGPAPAGVAPGAEAAPVAGVDGGAVVPGTPGEAVVDDSGSGLPPTIDAMAEYQIGEARYTGTDLTTALETYSELQAIVNDPAELGRYIENLQQHHQALAPQVATTPYEVEGDSDDLYEDAPDFADVQRKALKVQGSRLAQLEAKVAAMERVQAPAVAAHERQRAIQSAASEAGVVVGRGVSPAEVERATKLYPTLAPKDATVKMIFASAKAQPVKPPAGSVPPDSNPTPAPGGIRKGMTGLEIASQVSSG